jgi:hypothetical protein
MRARDRGERIAQLLRSRILQIGVELGGNVRGGFEIVRGVECCGLHLRHHSISSASAFASSRSMLSPIVYIRIALVKPALSASSPREQILDISLRDRQGSDAGSYP